MDDIREAASRIEHWAQRTPLIKSRYLDALTGADVWLKPECLQVTGSFKFRGACNAVASLSDAERDRGILAVSSGNHAQGIAEAARLMGVSATIIMPADAPRTKIARTRRSGATIVTYDRLSGDREALANQHAGREGLTFIHPFENRPVIAGQGTVGLEICDDLSEQGKAPNRLFVPTGGGGLIAGIALVVKDRFANSAIHPCEPEGFDDYGRSLASGRREANAVLGGSVCDAIVTPSPGERSLAICRSRLAQGRAVSDDEAMAAVALAFNELKLVVEPGGAVGLATLLKAGNKHAGETIVVVLSGGNIDAETMAVALAGNRLTPKCR